VTYPQVLLANNRNISPGAFERADGLRRSIAKAVEHRDAYVTMHRLDPSFCLPDSNWGEKTKNTASTFLSAYRYVRDGEYEVLNRLRFWAPYFSGYEMMWLRPRQVDRPSVEPIPPDHDDWIKTNRTEPDQWVNLWVEFTKIIPPALRFSPPVMLGEIGWLIDGIVVNHDTYVYQERLNILYEAGIIDWLQRLGRPPRILEIGGGYGALAFMLRRVFSSSVCMICDLPESLMFAGLYLTLCEQDRVRLVEPGNNGSDYLSEPGVSLLPNYMLHLLREQNVSFDLVINTLSMSEMTADQVDAYAVAIARLIGKSGVFFEQNQDNRHCGWIDCKDHIRGHFPWSQRLQPRLAAMTEGRADLWANAEPLLSPVRVPSKVPQLLDSIEDYNIVDYNGFIFGLPQALGSVDLAQTDVVALKGVIRDVSRQVVERKIRGIIAGRAT
jgi:hypothetical protein